MFLCVASQKQLLQNYRSCTTCDSLRQCRRSVFLYKGDNVVQYVGFPFYNYNVSELFMDGPELRIVAV